MKKKIIAQCWLISALTALIVFFTAAGVMYALSERDVKNALTADARIYTDLMSYAGEEGLDALRSVDQWKIRVTILDTQGNVLFESDRADAGFRPDNHLDRAEVSGALQGNPQIIKRYSQTFRREMYYYALVSEGTPQYVVRIARPAADLWNFVGAGLPYAAAALVVALIASYFFARKTGNAVSRQMHGVKDGLKALNEGSYRPVVATMSDADNFAVVTEMNELFERTQAHYRALNEERAKQDFIFNRISYGILALDDRGCAVYLNDFARSLFGGGRIGGHYMGLIDDARFCEKIEETMRTRQSSEFECDFGERSLVVSVSDTANTGFSHEVSCMVLLSDVTAEKDALRQKSEFFANASHELKTPLTSLRGLSELLLAKEPIDDQTRKYLTRIHTESERLNRLVLDLLYIDELDGRARKEERYRPIALHRLCEDALQEYAGEIARKKIETKLIGNAWLDADERDIGQLAGNLIGNAVHYNRENGSVEITVESSAVGVSLVVKDSGIGISSEDLPKVCERFFRVDKSRSKKTGGTGLGLAIVKHIAARYGAQLTIDSVLGQGTSVRVEFPACTGSSEKQGDSE